MVSMVMLNTEWDLELSWFIRVAPTERFFLPTCIHKRHTHTHTYTHTHKKHAG
jgi:hypothetical protein